MTSKTKNVTTPLPHSPPSVVEGVTIVVISFRNIAKNRLFENRFVNYPGENTTLFWRRNTEFFFIIWRAGIFQIGGSGRSTFNEIWSVGRSEISTLLSPTPLTPSKNLLLFEMARFSSSKFSRKHEGKKKCYQLLTSARLLNFSRSSLPPAKLKPLTANSPSLKRKMWVVGNHFDEKCDLCWEVAGNITSNARVIVGYYKPTGLLIQ